MELLPGYRDLYFRWEREQWSAEGIDLGRDHDEWLALAPEARGRVEAGIAILCAGKTRITDLLVPFVDAAPSEEQQLFLTSQLVDEARHAVFLDRICSDVLGDVGLDMEERLTERAGGLAPADRAIFDKLLLAASERIGADLTDVEAFRAGVKLYHLEILAGVQLPAVRSVRGDLNEAALLPGTRSGMEMIARDLERHVSFGRLVLGEATS